MRVQGHNLLSEGPGGRIAPSVTLGGQPMAVVRASERELVLAPQAHQWAGELSVKAAGAPAASMSFDLTPFAPPAPPAPLAGELA
jgi:hypothetical protein